MKIQDFRPIEEIRWSWGMKPKDKMEWWMNHLKGEPRSQEWKHAYATQAETKRNTHN